MKNTATPEKYQGLIQSLVRIGKDEGLIGYFKGNMTNIVRAVPYQAAQFVSYEKYKMVLYSYNNIICSGLVVMTRH